MRVVVHVLLDLECLACALHLYADHHIEVISLGSCLCVVLAIDIELWRVCILHECALMHLVGIGIDTCLHECLIALVHHVVLASHIHHRTSLGKLVDHEERWHLGSLCHLGIVGTEGWRDMYDTRTVFCCDIVARNHAECLLFELHELILSAGEHLLWVLLGIFLNVWCSKVIDLLAWLHPWHQLLILHAHEVRALVSSHDAVWQLLAVDLLHVERLHLCQSLILLTLEISTHTSLCHHDGELLAIIWIEGLYSHIVDVRTYAESRIRWQCPRCGCPCNECRLAPLFHLWLCIDHAEDTSHRRILDITVAARLVELVARQACSRTWRIWLDGVALVEQSLVVKLLEHPPQSLDVAVVVSDIWIIKIDPVAHLVCKVGPFLGIFHYLLAAGSIVFIDRDLLADILLGDAKALLDTELDRQTVGIPTCLALHLIALHRLETAEDILDRTCHHVVDTWHTIGRRRTLIEDKRRMTLTSGHTLFEDIVFVPLFQHLLVDFREVETVIFCKFHSQLLKIRAQK